jgi:hypothetical protein
MLKKLKMLKKLNFNAQARDYSDYRCNNNKININYNTYPTDQQATPFYINIDNTNRYIIKDVDRKTLNLKGCYVTISPAEYTEITTKEDSFSNIKTAQAKDLASHKIELKFKASFNDFSVIKEEYR